MNTNHSEFDRRLAELTGVWNAHQELRRRSASVAELATSRRRLDRARARIRGLKAA